MRLHARAVGLAAAATLLTLGSALPAEAAPGPHWSEAPFVPAGQVFLPYGGTAHPTPFTTWVAGSKMTDNQMSPQLLARDPYPGAAWHEVPLPALPAGASAQINDLDTLGPASAFMVGEYSGPVGGFVTERWDGRAWRIIPAPASPDSSFGSLLDVEELTPNDAWAVGFEQHGDEGALDSVIRHWDGTAWRVAEVPQVPGGTALFSMSAVSDHEIYAVGRAWQDFRPVMMRYDGTAWRLVDLPPIDAEASELRSVVARGPNDVWAVGGARDPKGTTRGLVLHNDGTGWREVPLPAGTDVLDKVAATPDGVAVVGNGDNAPFGLYLRAGAWRSLNLPAEPGLTVHDLDVAFGTVTVAAFRYTETSSASLALTARF
ncbi:hypothetical protein [Yinghuangia seranimata]|uniref:hypothetical protein n=1 Tax=Yinghuangia seranimata TaxID=408067 RepID=UPI00248B48F3|nr:hypothetical protein [Yinghuangia seranimata]MDI2124705.1 hypothetical protein [Yinghuangia seranimata]